MDLDETVTVCKLYTPNGLCYLLICWFVNSFELNLYAGNKLWKGIFSADRLESLSKNLQLTEDAYYSRIKQCLTKQRADYRYEFRNGFFSWKRQSQLLVIIEGFLPLDIYNTSAETDLPFIEALININRNLKERLKELQIKLTSIRSDYKEHLEDTEDFLNLKEKMEQFLCQKFQNLINLKKSKIRVLDSNADINFKPTPRILELSKVNLIDQEDLPDSD